MMLKKSGVTIMSIFVVMLFTCPIGIGPLITDEAAGTPTFFPTATSAIAPTFTNSQTPMPSSTPTAQPSQTTITTATVTPSSTATKKPVMGIVRTTTPTKTRTPLPTVDQSCSGKLGTKRTLHFGESFDISCVAKPGTTVFELQVPDGRNTIVALVTGENGTARGMELSSLAPEQYSACVSHWQENGSDCKRKFDETSKPRNIIPGQSDYVSVRAASQRTGEYGWLILLTNNLTQSQVIRFSLWEFDNTCVIRTIVTGNPIDAAGWVICKGGVFDHGD